MITLGFLLILSSVSGCSKEPNLSLVATPTLKPTPTNPISDPSAVQQVSSWYQVYAEQKESSGSEVLVLDDGSFLIVGGVGMFGDDQTIGGVMLMYVDPKGNLIWQEIYGSDGYEFGLSVIESAKWRISSSR